MVFNVKIQKIMKSLVESLKESLNDNVEVISEALFENEHSKNPHGIFEMARVSDTSDQLPNNASIWVYGEKDEQGTKPPHFHIIIDKGKFEFEVTFDHFHDLKIWRSKTVKHDWKEYSKLKKAIKKWLNQDNVDMEGFKNIKAIMVHWNANNSNSKVDINKFLNLCDKLNQHRWWL